MGLGFCIWDGCSFKRWGVCTRDGVLVYGMGC